MSSPSIHAETAGARDGEPVVLLHGFTQTGRSWAPVLEQLHQFRLVLLDAPAHGRSVECPAGLVEAGPLLARAAPRPATWVGYSMGGRYALHVAIQEPQALRRLVLVSTTAGIDDPEERAARRRSDESLADHLLEVGVDAFLEEWLANPLFAGLPRSEADRLSRTANSAVGLARSLREAGTGTQEPLWDELLRLDMPVLVVAGADDHKFVALAHRLVAAIGANASLAVVPDAGHAVHLHQPDVFAALVLGFITSTG